MQTVKRQWIYALYVQIWTQNSWYSFFPDIVESVPFLCYLLANTFIPLNLATIMSDQGF